MEAWSRRPAGVGVVCVCVCVCSSCVHLCAGGCVHGERLQVGGARCCWGVGVPGHGGAAQGLQGCEAGQPVSVRSEHYDEPPWFSGGRQVIIGINV